MAGTVTTNTNTGEPTPEARGTALAGATPTSKPRRRHYISWEEFCQLAPPDDVRADMAYSIFGPGRYVEDILPQTWKFLRQYGVGVSRYGDPR